MSNFFFKDGGYYKYNLCWIVEQIKGLMQTTGSLQEAFNEFLDKFQDRLDDTVKEQLQAMLDDGDLAAIIQSWIDSVPYVNVKDMGAKGDGTTNDTAAFQKALEIDGLFIFIPNGVYPVNDITITNKVLIGEYGATLKPSGQTNNTFITANNSYFLNIEFNYTDGYYKPFITGSVILMNCSFSGSKSNAVQLDAKSLIENCEFTSNNIGIYIMNGNGSKISNCNIHNNNSHGILIGGDYTVSNTIINGCRITNNSGSAVNSSFKTGSSTGETIGSNLTVTNCYINKNAIHGIENRTPNSYFAGNLILDNGTIKDTQGIVTQASGCRILNNEIGYQQGVGIDLGNASQCVVSENYIHECYFVGIEVNYASRNTISNNVVRQNVTLPTTIPKTAGIWIRNGQVYEYWSGPSSYNTVTGNYVEYGANQNYGIYIDSASNYNLITGNNLYNNPTSILNESTNSELYGNLTK